MTITRKKLLVQGGGQSIGFAKTFCRLSEMGFREVDYCCLECSLATTEEESGDGEANKYNLEAGINITISCARRLHKRYSSQRGRAVKPSYYLSERKNFWKIIFPWLPWKKNSWMNNTLEKATLHETIVRSGIGLRLLISIVQVIKKEEFRRECLLTSRGFYRNLQRLESNSEGDGLFHLICRFRSLVLKNSSIDHSLVTPCSETCRQLKNSTLTRIFDILPLKKWTELELLTKVCLMDAIKYLHFLQKLIRIL